MRPEDRRFIVPTWVRSFAEYAPWSRAATLRGHWAVADTLLDAPDVRVMVLASDEAARTLHAWAAGVGDALHYVYVPPELRGHGLARRCITALLGSYPKHIDVTHPWPRESARYRWQPYPLQRSAA
jgi:GNAT superfamily N-acetyltransferase